MTKNDWWSKKLGGQGGAPKSPMPPTGPAPQVPYIAPPQQPNVQVNYDPDTDQVTRRAQSSKLTDHCPECNSGNYFAPRGTQRMRCYDCGYPIQQQGSGLSGSADGKPVQRAKQVGQGDGFNPNLIVDRIG